MRRPVKQRVAGASRHPPLFFTPHWIGGSNLRKSRRDPVGQTLSCRRGRLLSSDRRLRSVAVIGDAVSAICDRSYDTEPCP